MVKGTYSRRWLFAIWAALAFTGGYFISILIAYCTICTPLSAYWEGFSGHYHEKFTCIDATVLVLFIGILSVISDIYAVILPSLMLRHYNLDVARRQKIGLNIIFGLSLR